MKHVARSSLIIAVFFGIDKVLGFIRQVLIARQFGLSYEIDVFNAANNIPDLLSALISGGALGVALIPVLSEYLDQRGRSDAWDLFSRILNLAFLVTAAISLVIILLADPIVRNLIAPGFPEAQKALTVELMRLDLIAILIFSISGLAMAGLQANQHFLLPALAPGLYNIGQIFGIAILAPEQGISLGPLQLPAFGLGIHGLVYGVILGAFLHLGIQIPGLLRFGFRWTPAINLKNPGVRQVLSLLGPRIATMFFLQVFFIARDNLASRLGEGAVTALNYGWFIMQVPETLIGSALAIAILPTLSEYYARRQMDQFRQTIHNAVRTLLALTIPTAALLSVALRPLVSGLFGFDAAGVELVVWATRGYLLGLAGHALLETAARSFYAQQNARTPLFAAALNAGSVHPLSCFAFTHPGSSRDCPGKLLSLYQRSYFAPVLAQQKNARLTQFGSTLAARLSGVCNGSDHRLWRHAAAIPRITTRHRSPGAGRTKRLTFHLVRSQTADKIINICQF